jgi:hypothetical protein
MLTVKNNEKIIRFTDDLLVVHLIFTHYDIHYKTTTCVISAYHHSSCEVEPCSWQGVLDATLCDQVCQLLATGRWFSPDTPVSSTNKTDCHNIIEILLKVALSTINQPIKQQV